MQGFRVCGLHAVSLTSPCAFDDGGRFLASVTQVPSTARRPMPSNAHCCVPGCTNRRSACKWGLVPDGSGGFTKRRLCGSNDVGGCKNTADCCRSLSFHRLPSQKKTLKEWIVRIRRVNLPVNSNSRVCGVHFSNKRTTEATSPDLFLWTKGPQKRTTRSAHLAAVADLPQEEVR